MKLVYIQDEFRKIERCYQQIIAPDTRLPKNVFKETYKHFLFITFDEMFMELFFDRLMDFLKAIEENNCWLVVIDPAPREFFGKHLGFYGSIEISIEDSFEDYTSALFDSPQDSAADALIHCSNTLVITSDSSKWAIFGDRESEIAVCGFSNDYYRNSFSSAYGTELLDGVAAAAECAYGSIGNHQSAKELCKNYS